MTDKLSADERSILEQFQRGEWKAVPNPTDEIQAARQAARRTLNKTRRVNLRVTEKR